MLYESLLQGKTFLVVLYFGIVAGVLLTIKKIIDRPLKKSKIFITLSDIFYMLICSLLFLLTKTKFCYGEFRLFELIAFFMGILLQQFSLNNLVEKILHMLYNLFVKVTNKLKKIKLFGKILK